MRLSTKKQKSSNTPQKIQQKHNLRNGQKLRKGSFFFTSGRIGQDLGLPASAADLKPVAQVEAPAKSKPPAKPVAAPVGKKGGAPTQTSEAAKKKKKGEEGKESPGPLCCLRLPRISFGSHFLVRFRACFPMQ